ncbi:Papain inhibitor [Psilocybe cubensis]|nr:Papain inhibitor [Psilocybe cubensis]KAH9476928.1 Papain inhibitor [Psilocybe cubensis]
MFAALSILSPSVSAINNGLATWYYDGIGACGGWNVNTDFIVALNPIDYAGGTKCGKKIKVNYQGKSIIVQVVDLCPSCGWKAIDLSQSAFQALAPLSQGIIQISWDYI